MPRVGLDLDSLAVERCLLISIHPPRVGWDGRFPAATVSSGEFQSTHPVWGGTMGVPTPEPTAEISIHPPRVGWDASCAGVRKILRFQSTHPVWGGTPSFGNSISHQLLFQSTHPVWSGTRIRSPGNFGLQNFNPPTPCGVGLQRLSKAHRRRYFNPPTPCGVGPVSVGGCQHQTTDFNPPTPCGVGRWPRRWANPLRLNFNPPTPCGVGRFQTISCPWTTLISIHPPRVGWDEQCPGGGSDAGDFNPPTPCGVGPSVCEPYLIIGQFQSTHPVWGGTVY